MLMVIEFQSRPDPQMALRVQEYGRTRPPVRSQKQTVRAKRGAAARVARGRVQWQARLDKSAVPGRDDCAGAGPAPSGGVRLG